MSITLLRGFILILLSFWLMPQIAGVPGIWLAVPVSEFLTFSSSSQFIVADASKILDDYYLCRYKL